MRENDAIDAVNEMYEDVTGVNLFTYKEEYTLK